MKLKPEYVNALRSIYISDGDEELKSGRCLMCGHYWNAHKGIYCDQGYKENNPNAGYYVSAAMLARGTGLHIVGAKPNDIVALLTEIKKAHRDDLSDELYERIDKAIEALTPAPKAPAVEVKNGAA